MTDNLKNMLHSQPNPHRNKSYIVTVMQEITANNQIFMLGLRYIPDKLLLDHAELAAYLAIIATGQDTAAALAHHIIEDVIDQIIPRWIEINLKQQQNESGQTILITAEDHQPGWKYPPLLNRLPALF